MWCKKWSDWTFGVGARQKIRRLTTPALTPQPCHKLGLWNRNQIPCSGSTVYWLRFHSLLAPVSPSIGSSSTVLTVSTVVIGLASGHTLCFDQSQTRNDSTTRFIANFRSLHARNAWRSTVNSCVTSSLKILTDVIDDGRSMTSQGTSWRLRNHDASIVLPPVPLLSQSMKESLLLCHSWLELGIGSGWEVKSFMRNTEWAWSVRY